MKLIENVWDYSFRSINNDRTCMYIDRVLILRVLLTLRFSSIRSLLNLFPIQPTQELRLSPEHLGRRTNLHHRSCNCQIVQLHGKVTAAARKSRQSQAADITPLASPSKPPPRPRCLSEQPDKWDSSHNGGSYSGLHREAHDGHMKNFAKGVQCP